MPIAIMMILFIVDLLTPRGTTPAIGYCIIPVLAARTGRRKFMIAITLVCMIFTVLAFFLEPIGEEAWMEIVNRALIIGALGLTFLLVLRLLESAYQTHRLAEKKSELERSNAELEHFASIIAHDIRGPVNTIGLLSQLLCNRGPIEPNVSSQDYGENIQELVDSLNHLIQRLLTYGRVGGGQLRIESCDCEKTLESVRRKLKSLIEKNNATVTNDPLPTLAADPEFIGELFQNLIENGIKYCSSEPPHIHVSAVRGPDGWSFAVRDNGKGIESIDLQQIFEPFHQGANADRRRGVGLGLTTCKRIVERHGGQLGATSIVGSGSTFTFNIPHYPADNIDKPIRSSPAPA